LQKPVSSAQVMTAQRAADDRPKAISPEFHSAAAARREQFGSPQLPDFPQTKPAEPGASS
jgi:hypothetical protein